METFIYGLHNSNHDFTKASSFGKNIFTNAFPLSLLQYLSIKRNLKIPVIKATHINGKLTHDTSLTELSKIFTCNPHEAYFEFEGVFSEYNNYTHGSANKSDVVVKNLSSGQDVCSFEIKLVVVPTSSTASKSRAEQSCEIVVRPPTIEQLAFSIANSYGESKRYWLQELISNKLVHPNDCRWQDRMLSELGFRKYCQPRKK